MNATTRIINIHRCSILRLKIDLMAALASDISPFEMVSFSVDGMWEMFSCLPKDLLILIRHSLDVFEKSFQKITLSGMHANRLSVETPNLFRKLGEHGFICTGETRLNTRKYIVDSNEIPIYTSVAGIGFSFGSLLYLFAYLQAYVLGATDRDLVIYELPEEYSVFPELLELVDRAFESVRRKNASKHNYTHEELIAINESGSTKGMHIDISNRLYSTYDIESEMVSSDARGTGTRYPANCYSQILGMAAKTVTRKIMSQAEFPNLHNKISNFINPRKSLVLISNRDSNWVGHGQSHRDINIAKYRALASRLIDKGMQVIRFNTIGIASDLVHRDFLDLTQIDGVTAFDQMHLASMCRYVIGANNGALAFAQFISGSPTLVIDAPDVTPHSPWASVVQHPKTLMVKDKARLSEFTYEEVLGKLFSPGHCWSDDLLTYLGLCSKSTDSSELANLADEFTQGDYINLQENNTSLLNLGVSCFSNYNTVLSQSAFRKLQAFLLSLDAICRT